MNSILVSLLFIVSIPAVITTTHSTCFNYFLQKDGCVFSSASSKLRCAVTKKHHPSPVHPFMHSSYRKPHGSKTNRLDRRYDSHNPSFPIASGDGICGVYDSTEELGVCLWSGAEQTNSTVATSGWLNGLKTSNCGKRIYIQRTGRPETVQYARVVDGCSFDSKAPKVGCFEIGLTLELFDRFNPTEKEKLTNSSMAVSLGILIILMAIVPSRAQCERSS